MTFASVIHYLLDRKMILTSVAICLVSLFVMIFGMFVCDKSFWNYMFVWIIPGTAIVLLGTYAVSMTDKHPIILIFPPIIFFASLFIRFLVTYEYLYFTFLFLQCIPCFVFGFSLKKEHLQKEVATASQCGILSSLCFLISVIVIGIMERSALISLPLHVYTLLEILVYIEVAVGGIYFAIFYINEDKREMKVLKN